MKYKIGDTFRYDDEEYGYVYIGTISSIGLHDEDEGYVVYWDDGDKSYEYDENLDRMTRLDNSKLPEDLFIL